MLSTKVLFTSCRKVHLLKDTHTIKYISTVLETWFYSHRMHDPVHIHIHRHTEWNSILHGLHPYSPWLLHHLLPPPPWYNLSSNNNPFKKRERAEGEKGISNITSFYFLKDHLALAFTSDEEAAQTHNITWLNTTWSPLLVMWYGLYQRILGFVVCHKNGWTICNKLYLARHIDCPEYLE